MGIFNQFSYLWIALGVIVVIALIARLLLHQSWRVIGVLALVGVVVTAAGWGILRIGNPDLDDVAATQRLIAESGKPTLVEFYSNYCVGCMSVRPDVDQLMVDIESQGLALNFVRIDIHTEAGRELREQYAFSFTPEFVLFDADGQEIWREHFPPALADLAQVALPQAGA